MAHWFIDETRRLSCDYHCVSNLSIGVGIRRVNTETSDKSQIIYHQITDYLDEDHEAPTEDIKPLNQLSSLTH